MKKKIILITSYAFIIDQIIKYFVCNYLTNKTIIPNFISLIYAENKGVAFSMLEEKRIFIVIMSIILLFLLAYSFKKDYFVNKKSSHLVTVSYGLLFGGILGNLVDRIVRGYVVDYVSLNIVGYHFPIFNLADVLITIGVIIMIILTIKDKDEKHS